MQVDFEETQKKFTDKLAENSFILDFGCGSGRDTKYFIEHGYKVDAVDGSKELCRRASEYTGIAVRNMMFTQLDAKEKYDGIWACSSILHLTKDELENVMDKMTTALKPNGIIYASFKYGNFSGERNGRYFTDMTEEAFGEFIEKIDGITLEEQWITSDVRAGRGEEKWLNVLLRRG
nr:class I SAM-dependent methyltransferase [Eubacterium sp. MSJ-13]